MKLGYFQELVTNLFIFKGYQEDIKVIGCQLFVLLQKIKCLVDFGSYRFPFLEFD